MIILQSVSARRISSVCRAPERIHLLFFGTDGADIPDIPRVDFGMQQHGENKMRQLLKVTAPATALLALAYVAMAMATPERNLWIYSAPVVNARKFEKFCAAERAHRTRRKSCLVRLR